MAIILVQTGSAFVNTPAAPTLQVVMPKTTAGGNMYIAVVGGGDFGVTCTPSDTLGNNWQQFGPTLYDSTIVYQEYAFYVQSTKPGTATITFTFSADTQYSRAVICEYYGTDRIQNLGGFTGNGVSSVTTTVTSGPFTLQRNNSLIWMGGQSVGWVPNITAGTGYTKVSNPPDFPEMWIQQKQNVGSGSKIEYATATFDSTADYSIFAAELFEQRRNPAIT